jgi:hypothetical protein
MAKRTTSKKTGTARMIELGYRPLQIWLSPTMQRALEAAAAEERVAMTRVALSAISHSLAQRALEKGKTHRP